MFPMTVTVSNPTQLNAVMAALGFAGAAQASPCTGHAVESAKEEAKANKKGSKPEKAQAEVAQNTASSTSEVSIAPTEAVVEQPAPEAATSPATGAADVVQMTAAEAEKALHGHANNPPDAPTYQATADAVTKLARTKGRDAAVAVLNEFGAAKLPDVKPEQFAAIIAACEKAGA
ncbi:MAG TPA: hypothetical protein GXX56_09105 [Rhodocyclaceae bacterium]|nr:hypothetical protein [Rhodocyclaceae bacterium]